MRLREVLFFIPPTAFIAPAIWCVGFIILLWLIVNGIVTAMQSMAGLL